MVRGFKICVEGEKLKEPGAGRWEPGAVQVIGLPKKNETGRDGGWSYRVKAEKARREEVA